MLVRKFKTFVFTVLISLSCFALNAQPQSKIDSLEHALQQHEAKKSQAGKQFNPLQDSTKVLLMYDLFICYLMVEDVAKSDSLSDACMNLSRKINYKKGIGIGYSCLGTKEARTNPVLALGYHQKSLTIREEVGDTLGMARSLVNIALMYYVTGKRDSAIEMNRRVVEFARRHNLTEQLAAGYHNLGMCYAQTGNINESCKYYFKAKLINEQPGGRKDFLYRNLRFLSTNYNTVGRYRQALEYGEQGVEVCGQLGLGYWQAVILGECVAEAYRGLKKFDSAIYTLQRSIELFKNSIFPDRITAIYLLMGNTYLDQGDYQNALKYNLLAFEDSSASNKYLAAPEVCNIALAYANMHQYKEALPFAQKSLVLAKSLNANDLLYYSYQALSIIYSGTGNYQLADHYEKLHGQYFDSIYNEKNRDLALKQQLNYDFERWELQDRNIQDRKDTLARQELDRQKLVRNGFLGGSVFILLLAGLFFRQRNQIRKGKERSEELLLNILPVEIAKELKTNGKSSARNFDLATILFTDFKDFTEISSRMSGEDLVSEINHCFKGFDHIIEKYGLEKIKTIGDAYMAVGGVPSPATNSVRNTILAGLEMQSFIKARSLENSQTGKQSFTMRLGIHTGPVVAGIVGIKKFQYDLWGETVDMAQQMEKCGKVGMATISQATFEIIKDDPAFDFEFYQTISDENATGSDAWIVHHKKKVL